MREGLDLRNSLRDEFEHVMSGFLREVRAQAVQGLMHAGGISICGCEPGRPAS